MKEERKVTMTEVVSNLCCIPMLGICAVAAVLFYLRVGASAYEGRDNIYTIIAVMLSIPSIMLHELIHAWGWKIAGKTATVKYGIKLPFTAYIQFDGKMKTEQFMFGVILPLVITGLIPAIIGLISGNFYIFIYGIIMTPGCGSDVLSFIRCFKYLGREVADTHGETGFVVLAQ